MFKSLCKHKVIAIKLVRYVCVATRPEESPDRIKAWQVHSYGEELQCCSIRNPVISSPTEVLVKIEASSLNPLDILMQDGYGRILNKFFNSTDELVLPITLGRDFSGTIVDKGHGVGSSFNVGDKIYGIVPFHKPGTHAEYAIADKSHIVQQPCALTHTEAAAIPYTALTAYSALWITGGLCYKKNQGLRVLILGASGGVGSCAVQMLRAVKAEVFGACSTDAVPLVQSLRADCVFDYTDPNYIENVASLGSFDIILDCAEFGYQNIPPAWKYSEYISLNSPLLKNTDQYGLIGGLALSAANLIQPNVLNISQKRCMKWAYFYPSSDGLKFIDKLIRNCELVPVISKTFKFNEMSKAFETVKAGHLRGKIVIDMLEEK